MIEGKNLPIRQNGVENMIYMVLYRLILGKIHKTQNR